MQLEAENGTLENVEIAAGAIMMLQVVTDNIWGFAMCQFLAGCFIIGLNSSLNPALVKYAPGSFHGRVFGLSLAAQQLGNMAGFLIAATVRLLFSHLAGISSGGNHLVCHGICNLLAAYMKKRIWKIKYFR